MPMRFLDPDDPEGRKMLDEIGAPPWYPQNAPRHTMVKSGEAEQLPDGTWLSKFICPICGHEKHFTSGPKFPFMKIVNEGDPWAIHSGAAYPELFRVTKLDGIPSSEADGNDDLWTGLFGFLEGQE